LTFLRQRNIGSPLGVPAIVVVVVVAAVVVVVAVVRAVLAVVPLMRDVVLARVDDVHGGGATPPS
jgi:hypothetical protein